jgi:hypothetical protein
MQQINQSQQAGSFVWGKVAGMIFAVGIPALLTIVANNQVFPDSSWLATGMVLTTFGVAVIFAVASSYATDKVRKYVLMAALVLAVELAANLAVHWVLSREVSGAKQATTARHDEEDRAEARREAEAKRQKELMAQQKELLAEQKALTAETARQLRYEAIRNDSARRLGIRAPRGATVTTPPSAPIVAPTIESTVEPITEPTAKADGQIKEPPKTVEQVMAKYSGWLLVFAIIDLLSSVVAFGVCALLWEWDRNRNGIPDHLENSHGVEDDIPTYTDVRPQNNPHAGK